MVSFLLFGQSNMAGADAIAPLPWKSEASDIRSKLYHVGLLDDGSVVPYGSTSLAPYEQSTGVFVHGPEIAFAREMQEYLPADYLLIKVTGNIPPNEPEFLWAIDKLYMRKTCEFYRTTCRSENTTPIPAAVLMAQGIDEALSEVRWQNYKANLFALVRDLREHFHSPNLPFIVAQSVKSPLADPRQMTIIRDAQRQASIELSAVDFVEVDDLAPYVRWHHMTSRAQLEFGRRFAQALIKRLSLV